MAASCWWLPNTTEIQTAAMCRFQPNAASFKMAALCCIDRLNSQYGGAIPAA